MRVLHLSYADLVGGANRAAYRLHRALLGAGCDSTMAVRIRQSEDDEVRELNDLLPVGTTPKTAFRVVRANLMKRSVGVPSIPYSVDRGRFGAELARVLPDYDVLHLHWLSIAFDLPSFLDELPHDKPIFWTLHDLNPITGGCHYPTSCEAFAMTCGECPAVGSDRSKDLSTRIQARRRNAVRALHPTLEYVSPSGWVTEMCRKSAVGGDSPCHTIPHGLDSETFAVRNRREARGRLGIPEDQPVVGFVAHSFSNPLKGVPLFMEAMQHLRAEPIWIAMAGDDSLALDTDRVIRVGYLNDEKLVDFYNAIDVLAVPSLYETFGQVAAEAICCGTPVVAFRTSGLIDVVSDSRFGALVPTGDTVAFANAISEYSRCYEGEPGRRERGEAGRSAFAMDLFAKRHIEVYEASLARKRSAI